MPRYPVAPGKVSTALRQRPTSKQFFGSTPSISRKASIICESESLCPESMSPTISRSIVVIFSRYGKSEKTPRPWMTSSQTMLSRTFCVPSGALLSLQRDTIFLKVPVKKTLFDSCHEDTERSCRRERKKSSVVKPRPPPSRKSCKRHSCRVVKQCPGKRNADLVVIFQAFKHFAVIFSALPLQDVTELGVRHGQSLNLPSWEYQLRSDRSVDQG
jgi:hypothetical protein